MDPQVTPLTQTPVIPPTLPTPTPKTKGYLIPMMFVLLVLTLITLGFLYFQNQKLSMELAKYQNQPSSPTPTVTQTPNNSQSDWKSYSYNLFSFKLPQDWTTTNLTNPMQFLNYTPLSPASEFDPIKDKGKLKIEINQIPSSDTLDVFVSNQKEQPITMSQGPTDWVQSEAVISGMRAIKVTHLNSVVYYLKSNSSSTIISVSFLNDFVNYQNLMNQILSTFKFVN